MKPAQIRHANNSEPDYALMQDIEESIKFQVETPSLNMIVFVAIGFLPHFGQKYDQKSQVW